MRESSLGRLRDLTQKDATRTLDFSLKTPKNRLKYAAVILLFLHFVTIYVLVSTSGKNRKLTFELASLKYEQTTALQRQRDLRAEIARYENPDLLLSRASADFGLHAPQNPEVFFPDSAPGTP